MDSQDVVEFDLDEEVAKAEAWGDSNDREALRDLTESICSSWEDRDKEAVEALCLAMLEHDSLPLFHRGRFHAYLSFIEGEDGDLDASDHLEMAANYLKEAADKVAATATEATGATDPDIAADIVEWQQKVRYMQACLVPKDELEAAERYEAEQAKQATTKLPIREKPHVEKLGKINKSIRRSEANAAFASGGLKPKMSIAGLRKMFEEGAAKKGGVVEEGAVEKKGAGKEGHGGQ